MYCQKVYFDIDADGFAEKVGWISADDGQLAFDANKNGKIDAGGIVIANERSEVWQSPLKTFNDNDLKGLNEIARRAEARLAMTTPLNFHCKTLRKSL